MPVAFDTDVLSLLLNPAIEPPHDPTTGTLVERAQERLEYLVAQLEREKTRIIIPAPAFGELMVIADEAGPDYVTAIATQAIFSIAPFDARAAIEAGAMTRAAIAKGNKKEPAVGQWQCVKTDRQIVAICKTLGVTRIYSNDSDMQKIAADVGIEVVHVAQLAEPPHEERDLPFNGTPSPDGQ
jgi:hypothetical protein